jgi:hypothetical protein
MAVMLSGAKHLAFSVTYKDEILRLSPQDDIASQSPCGEEGEGLNCLNDLNMILENISMHGFQSCWPHWINLLIQFKGSKAIPDTSAAIECTLPLLDRRRTPVGSLPLP